MKRRTLLTLTAIATLAFAPALPAPAQVVTIIVAGQPLALNPGPIERNGRVFVPLRGIFERLGATVVYSAGTINATKGRTTVSLQIGSTQATINGQPQILDVAPFIVVATTYVPLRFIAQSLGASVNYNDTTRVVAIGIGGGPPPMPVPVRPVPVQPVPPPVAPIGLTALQPGQGANVVNRFATISASFSRPVNAASVRVWLDGGNITNQCGISATAFSYKPPAPLGFGAHTVRVAGAGPGGLGFDRSWTFRVAQPPPVPPAMRLTINAPGSNAVVGKTFRVAGTTVAGGRVSVTAGASPNVTGQYAGTTVAGPLGNFALNVTLKTLLGQQSVRVRVTATNPANGKSTQTTLQLRLNTGP